MRLREKNRAILYSKVDPVDNALYDNLCGFRFGSPLRSAQPGRPRKSGNTLVGCDDVTSKRGTARYHWNLKVKASSCYLQGNIWSRRSFLSFSVYHLFSVSNVSTSVVVRIQDPVTFLPLDPEYIFSGSRISDPGSQTRILRLSDCSQTRTGMGHLRKPPGVELIPAVD